MTGTESHIKAKGFLERLEEHLDRALPSWSEIAVALGLSSKGVEGTVAAFPETEFLQQYIVKEISSFLTNQESFQSWMPRKHYSRKARTT
jgi:hypothetical protein